MREAEKRKIRFKLSEKQFVDICVLPCHYSGESEQLRGIDRWDSAKGYELTNSLPCCAVCNRAKMEMHGDEFTAWLKRAAKHLGLRDVSLTANTATNPTQY